MKGMKKFLSLLLCMMMVIGMLPTAAFADETTEALDLSTEFTEVQAFVDYLMGQNDPSTVASTWGSEFTWDTEKRETNKKDRLYDWSYYNGVVFEGLWYLYEVTGETKYLDYVVEYMEALIDEDGEWITSNSSLATNKSVSGYDAEHGGDTIKTASLLMDLYYETKDTRYLTMATTINADIDDAAKDFTLTDAGKNLRHNWEYSNSDPDFWLDGLYMVLPFRSEFAKYDNDTAELALIVDRLQWVSDNMYDEDTQWFYHAADSSKSNSGTFWLRSIGWYVAAIVDVMDVYADDLTSEDFLALKAQLKKVVDGLYATDSADNGYMWLNKMNGTYNKSNNPYETSGSSLIYYGVMKAVNNGWLDESYAAQAISCFEYMVANKLTDNTLTDICQKGAPTSSNSTFKDNEGKGVGPFIMLYAELLEYVNTITSIVVTPPTTLTYTVGDTLDTTGMTVIGVQRDGDEIDLTDKIEMEEIVLNEVGTQSITVTYNGMKATFEVTVEDVPVVDEKVTAKVEGHDAAVEAVVIPTTKVAEKVASVLNTENLVAYDISVDEFEEGQTAEVTIPMPEGVDSTKFMVWYVGDDDTLEPMNGHPNTDDWTYTFTTTHFSVYVGGEQNDDAEVDEDNSKSESTTVRQNGTNYTYVFSASPADFELGAGETQDITYTVTRNNSSHNFDADDIYWSTNNSGIATVDNGVVTGVSAGTATITASISVGSGNSRRTLSLNLSVTVSSKSVVSTVLSGNTPVTVSKGQTPEFPSLKYTITYDDGTTEVITEADGLFVTGYDNYEVGTYSATVTYNGQEIGKVTVYVADPEYPDDGAVRIKKTADESKFDTTGVTKVELSAAGISVKNAVNVILIMDISNSMSWNDSTYSYDDVAVTAGTNQRLNIAKTSAKKFVNTLLEGEDGSNTVTVLAFAGIDGDYNTHSTAAEKDDVKQLGALAMTKIVDAEAAIDQLAKANEGGTNYDYAFQQAYSLAGQLYAKNQKDVHIVFMTDGVPTHYNGVYYKSRSSTDITANMRYQAPGTSYANVASMPNYVSDGTDGNGTSIDSTATQNITVYYNDGTTTNKTVTYNKGWSDYVINNKNAWAEEVKDLDYVAKVYSIGFGLKNGSVTQGATSSMPTLDRVNGGTYYIPSSTTKTLLEHVASTPNDFYEADNVTELEALYASLASKIRYAGKNATAVDTIGSEFTLQTAAESGVNKLQVPLADHGMTPKITVGTWDLYTKADGVAANLIGTRKEGTFVEKELVIFSDDGLTAYSTVDGVTTEIPVTVDATLGLTKIEAETFTYTKTTDGVESFEWKIGDITDKEITLSFYAYLKDSLEGAAEGKRYYTNEEATLTYTDIFEDTVTKTFPVPAVVWGGASTAYEFYLVNEKGEPCDRNGNVVPFPNRIIITGPYYEELYLNQEDDNEAIEIIAAKVLPAGYTLYDETAKYTVTTASGELDGNLVISDPAEGKAQTTILVSWTDDTTETTEDDTYDQSHVAFGVIYNLIPDEVEFHMEPDTVVIDYGKDILINIKNNNDDVSGSEFHGDYKTRLVGFSKYYDNVDPNSSFSNTNAIDNYPAEYGTFSMVADEGSDPATYNDCVVRYTPTTTVDGVEKVFGIIEVYNDTKNDHFYMVDPITVIPATSVYYETDFADGVFDYTTTGTAWAEREDKDTGTNITNVPADGPQNDGTVGEGHYGYDSTYDNDAYLSNGSSYFVEGQGVKLNENTTKYTYVDFSFTGTGFDLISRTGDAQGAIRVNIYSDAARTKQVKSVTVLNKSESNLELYQIPVVSVHDLSADPATYYVRVHVNAAYTNTSYPALNRGGEFYFDAIRVYDPVDQDATDVKDAYLADGEYNYELEEVRNLLIEAGKFEAIEAGNEETGFVFIDRTQNGAELATYTTIGPNNEVYLSAGQAIAFKVTAQTVPASIDVGAKSITGEVAELSAVIADEATAVKVVKSIESSTAQNIDLMGAISGDALSDLGAYVIITNTGTGVLSITDIKVAYGNATAAKGIDFSVNANTLDVAFACLSLDPVVDTPEEPEDTTPEVPENPEEPEEIVPEEPEYVPNYDVLAAQFDSTKTRLLKNTTITVVTTQDVESVTVTDKYGLDKHTVTTGYVDSADGTRTWTVTVRPIMIGKQTYTVTGAGADGTTGASATAKINVKLF